MKSPGTLDKEQLHNINERECYEFLVRNFSVSYCCDYKQAIHEELQELKLVIQKDNNIET